jgi:hypothetical protein
MARDEQSRPIARLQACMRGSLAFALIAVLHAYAHAETVSAEVTFRWDYESAGAAGFMLYCGTSSQWYTTRVDLGNTDTAHLALVRGAVNFCALSAYDADGFESPFSNEVAIAVTDAAVPEVSVEQPITLAAGADAVTLTPTGFHVRFNRAIDFNALDLLWAERWQETPEVGLAGAKSGVVPGSIVPDPDNRGFTFVKTAGVLAPDNYTLTIRSGSEGLRDELGRPLDANGDGIFGDDFVLGFAILPGSEPILSIGEFARGPGQSVRLPAGSPTGGIPIRITNGAGITDVEFTLRYSPADLSLLGVRRGAHGGGDITLAAIDSEAGVAHIHLERLAGLTGATAELLILDAEVPMQARYGYADILDLSELQINGGAIHGKDDDGLHVVAYLGDSTGNAAYSSLDLARMQGLVLGTDRALAAYPLTDPVLIADVTGNGSISSLDMSRLSEWIRSGLDPAIRPEFEAMPVIP